MQVTRAVADSLSHWALIHPGYNVLACWYTRCQICLFQGMVGSRWIDIVLFLVMILSVSTLFSFGADSGSSLHRHNAKTTGSSCITLIGMSLGHLSSSQVFSHFRSMTIPTKKNTHVPHFIPFCLPWFLSRISNKKKIAGDSDWKFCGADKMDICLICQMLQCGWLSKFPKDSNYRCNLVFELCLDSSCLVSWIRVSYHRVCAVTSRSSSISHAVSYDVPQISAHGPISPGPDRSVCVWMCVIEE